jgi:DNA-3-methyladenine glycosylase II
VAAQELAERDPVIARLVAETGFPRFPRTTDTHFATLVQSIVYQQLAGAAARAIHGRLVAALGGEVTPERVLSTPPETLRAAGLSGRKVESLTDLAGRIADGTVILEPRRLARMTDEDIITGLSEVRGIGRWSAQMFLLLQLRRMDVWPTGDLAVRKGYALGWQVPVPTPKQLEVLGEPFRPYRTVAAWYCWTAAERYGRQQVALPV